MHKKLLAFALVSLLLKSSPAIAEGNRVEIESLTKLNNFYLNVEDVGPNDCNVTKDDVTTSLQYILSQSRMQITPSIVYAPVIYLNVNVSESCNAATVELSVEADVVIDVTKRHTFDATIWTQGRLLSGSNDMRERITADVEELAKRLVVDWSSVNPVSSRFLPAVPAPKASSSGEVWDASFPGRGYRVIKCPADMPKEVGTNAKCAVKIADPSDGSKGYKVLPGVQ